MRTLREQILFNCYAEDLWEILSDVTRCDWVTAIDKIIIDGDRRSIEMDGMGEITDKILLFDNPTMTLKYSAIATPTPIEHHLATMTVSPVNTLSCQLEWETEIDPEILADRIHQAC